MEYNFRSSFDHSYKKLSPSEQDAVDRAIDNLKIFFLHEIKKEGLGLKPLKWDFYEIRASKRIRVLFTFQDDTITFVIIGNHDDIRKYLKNL